MNRAALIIPALAAGLMAVEVAAQPQPNNLTVEQSAIAYDQCLAHAAVRVSRTDAANEAIYGLARDACAQTRAALLSGREGDRELNNVLAAIDADKEASFPALTQRVREQRRLRESQTPSQN